MAVLSPPRSAADALHDSPLPVIRALCATESDAEIVLSGSVSCYYEKQMAQEAVLPLLGARRLVNQVDVADRDDGRKLSHR